MSSSTTARDTKELLILNDILINGKKVKFYCAEQKDNSIGIIQTQVTSDVAKKKGFLQKKYLNYHECSSFKLDCIETMTKLPDDLEAFVSKEVASL